MVVDSASESSSNIDVAQSHRWRSFMAGGKTDGTRNPFSPSVTRSRYPFQSETSAGRP